LHLEAGLTQKPTCLLICRVIGLLDAFCCFHLIADARYDQRKNNQGDQNDNNYSNQSVEFKNSHGLIPSVAAPEKMFAEIPTTGWVTA